MEDGIVTVFATMAIVLALGKKYMMKISRKNMILYQSVSLKSMQRL